MVRRMIAKNAENKIIGDAVEYNVQHNSPIGAADCRPLVPEIQPIDAAAGSTATQRMGDKVKPKSLTVSGLVSLQVTSQTQKDIYVRLIIAAQKDVKVGSQINAGNIDAAHLLKAAYPGGAAGDDQVPFDGYTMDLSYPVNTDKFRVYMDKVVKLHQCAEGGVESIGKYSYRWRYKFTEKNLPASLTFDEGNGDWPNNFAPFFALGYAYSDGTVPDTITTRCISNVYSRLEFEDS